MLRTKALTTIILLTISFSGLAQIFEGKVIYKMEIKNADPNLPDSIFRKMYAGGLELTQVYYYKNNMYKSETEGLEVKSIQIYDPATNRTYGYTDGADVAFWSEGSGTWRIEKLDLKEDIMGIPCKAVLIKSGVSQLTLYYGSKFKIDAKQIKGDSFWEKYLRETGAIPLKYVIKGGPAKHYVVMTATEVKEEKLPDDIFKLPTSMKLMKSPF
ncbi:MAG: hypothetical protein ACK514_15115 [Bacteroidota bacterium]|jgi:hypothetical protein